MFNGTTNDELTSTSVIALGLENPLTLKYVGYMDPTDPHDGANPVDFKELVYVDGGDLSGTIAVAGATQVAEDVYYNEVIFGSSELASVTEINQWGAQIEGERDSFRVKMGSNSGKIMITEAAWRKTGSPNYGDYATVQLIPYLPKSSGLT